MAKRKSKLARALQAESKVTPSVEWQRRPELLLCPNIPVPMHGLAPRVVLGSSWWNKVRQAAYASTAQHCQACGVYKYEAKAKQHLEGHEVYKIDYQIGRMVYVETAPLCYYCHSFIHDGRLLYLLGQGVITHGRYASIIQHGNRVLVEAGLDKLDRVDRDQAMKAAVLQGKIAVWQDWRLVVEGKEYPPLYASFDEYRLAVRGKKG